VDGVSKNGRILLANLLQSSRSTFSWRSFLSFFAFQEGMVGTRVSALGGWPTVSGGFFETQPSLSQNTDSAIHCGLPKTEIIWVNRGIGSYGKRDIFTRIHLHGRGDFYPVLPKAGKALHATDEKPPTRVCGCAAPCTGNSCYNSNL
jgi:hypothetical protein